MDKISIRKVIQCKGSNQNIHADQITIEEPLEIKLTYRGTQGVVKQKSIAITMRTPGDDEALAKGFLLTEGIIKKITDIDSISFPDKNIVAISLLDSCKFDPILLDRNFYTSSSCGVCGKASLESIQVDTSYLPWMSKLKISADLLLNFLEQLKSVQSTFHLTGGIHAAALFNDFGKLCAIAEDVGRHNAMDKLIGGQIKFPLHDRLVLVSGRASFELVQKSAMAGIPILVAVGAPSSLAIDLAEDHGMTLIGFLKEDGFNIYSGADRII